MGNTFALPDEGYYHSRLHAILDVLILILFAEMSAMMQIIGEVKCDIQAFS